MTPSAPSTTGLFPSLVNWPGDEGALPGSNLELWWLTSLLQAGDRRLSTFALAMRIGNELVEVVVAVTDLDSGAEVARREVLSTSEVNLAEGRLEVSAPSMTYTGSFGDGYRLRGSVDDGTSFELAIQPVNPLLLNCGVGEYRWGETVTKQYAVGGSTTTGTVVLNGDKLDVTGATWYDRQAVLEPVSSELFRFTWFGIWLDSGHTLSLWDRTVADPNGKSWVTVVCPDGTHVLSSISPVSGMVSGTFKTNLGNEVPSGWKVEIPGLEATLEVTQSVVQDDPNKPFFTGALEVQGIYAGSPVRGKGVSDLVGWWVD